MINELYQLSQAMKRAGVETEAWHREYNLLPKVSEQAPCVQICLSDGCVREINFIQSDLAQNLRKYGNNQGTFPGMNLLPLYRVTDEDVKQQIQNMIKGELSETGVEPTVADVRSWCVNDNWNSNFKKQYRNSMVSIPEKIKKNVLAEYPCEPMQTLISETEAFADPDD